MNIRATGILIEDGKILLLKQKVDSSRKWSLPGGKLEENEPLGDCLIREIREETGLDVKIGRLLYICDLIKKDIHILHITFEMSKIGGRLGDLIEGKDTNPIYSIEMIPIEKLEEYGFNSKFVNLVKNNFSNAGSYMGEKKNIGL